MTFLPQLRDQLVAVPTAARSRRRRMFGGLVAFATLGPLLAAGALAATGVIPTGSPVVVPGPTPDPHRGGGAPVPSSARLLPLRVEDPAGGPPWGLRVVQTSRELTCVQVGRVVDGDLGVLGQDGVAGNDGRFHPLPLSGGSLMCSAPDGAGHAFMGISMATTASGPAPEPGCIIGSAPGSKLPPCAPESQRRVMFGLLGPEATSISYRDHGRVRSQAITGPDGAYLIVYASQPKHGGWSIGTMPAVGFTVRRIDYRDAPSCRGKRNLQTAQCPLVGYTPPSSVPTAESVRRPLHVRTHGSGIDVSFRAPVAVRDAKSSYTMTVQFDRGQGCRGAGSGARSDRNVAKGAIVHLRAALMVRCKGSVSGTVSYVPSSAAAGPMGNAPGDRANLTVGRFTYELP